MDAQVHEFLDKWAEKSTAKQEALAATGAAKLAEWKAEDAANPADAKRYQDEADGQWAIVAARGFQSGDEGRFYNEALALADAYVDAHPELVGVGSAFVAPEDASAEEKNSKHDLLVTLIAEAGKRGDVELAARLTMFELASFERKHIGAAVAVKSRRTNSRKAGV
jgi:GNAT superfamily N-acetyltransferase